jgi:glutathione S-transferase
VRLAYRAGFPALGPLMRKAMNIYPEQVEAARKTTLAALDRIARELQPSGYLVGDRFSVADLTAAALCSPFVEPPEFPYHPSVKAPEAVAAAREQLSAHPAIAYVREMYRRHRGASAAVTR